MRLVSNKKFRLYGVSEIPNENGRYSLASFDNDTINKIVDEDEIEDTLARLVRVLYGRGGKRNCYEITENMRKSEAININIDWDNRLVIPNILNKINVIPRHAQFFIVVSTDCLKCHWVVAVFQHTVYSDDNEWDLSNADDEDAYLTFINALNG